MLREYGKSYEGIWLKLSRPLIIILALALVTAVLYGVTVLWNMLSVKQEDIQKGLALQQQILRENISVLVTEAGYMTQKGPDEMLYVPALRVFVTNRTQSEVSRLFISVVFRTEDTHICRIQIPVLYLQPGETREVLIRCVEIIGFGTIMKGLRLIHTTHAISYTVELTKDDLTAPCDSGDLSFRILN